MSGAHYLSNTKTSLFSVEDDVDDEEFLRHPQSGRSGYMISSPNNQSDNTLEDLRQQQLDKQREIQSRIAQTSQRSLRLLRNSEEIGIATAEELLRQKEQLQRTEKRLEEINTTLRFSQKHIQGIKSVFGSFKNYLSGKTGDTPTNRPKVDTPTPNSSKSLLEAVDQTKPFVSAASQDHPGLRVRGLATAEPSSADAQDPEKQINENLDEMVHSITRLKGLASGLGEEIEAQNELVENIIGKTERADMALQRQNKDMTRLLN